ncbi:nitronate monooxygenase [Vandammella animalimorsus]|uniref:Nitronate monooxygenase n=1 Tax=Vandammella animalimorsus TaxID=2029117 RepID=A0A3M6RV58_9BURK|nr:nitronate monooxygenase [Vandammella animalimorsus]RMX18591.1 nitronate monooxygenase [Vandammella animalimorsus]
MTIHDPQSPQRLQTLSAPQRRFLELVQGWRLPLMAAPMFLVSGPELVIACAQAGVAGSFPAANARSIAQLDEWMARTAAGVAQCGPGSVFSMNMIVHRTYDRFEQEMALVQRYRPAIVSTALGSPARVLDAVHGYGGIVAADVISPKLARKAAEAGADVLILVAQGAGGHTGQYNPFAFIAEVRQFWQGPLGLAGAISSGRDIRAAQLLGADFVLAGTRFIAATESLAAPAYRELLAQSDMEDLVLSSAVSGVPANWLRQTLDSAGIASGAADAPAQVDAARIDFSGDIAAGKKAWKHVWSAGHGVAAVQQAQPAAAIVQELHAGYLHTLAQECEQARALYQKMHSHQDPQEATA